MRRTIPICLKLKKAQLFHTAETLGPPLVFLLLASMTASARPAAPGTLRLTLVDEASGRPTPARVELLDAQGKGYVAQDALPIDGDCVDRDIPADYTVERAIAVMSKQFVNQFTKTVQFYSVGKSFVSLPPGDYRLIVRKGPEFQLQKRDVHINPGEIVNLEVPMSRWVNLSAEGWYSADDHLHIARPVKELNPFISKWMQAEDVHVANLLEWGLVRHFHNALQYAFGEEGQYREGDYLLATGQENPRTHFRGHTIILGGKTPINFPEAYVIYSLFWEEAERQGALKGYAHWGKFGGAEYGLSVDLPGRLLNFIEVLQFEHGIYDVWYDTLNMGFRMTPTAGTDYPCGDNGIPGRERFYTQVAGPLTYESWLEGVRKGRTFVTNGPMLDFHINGKGIGDEVLLKKPGTVTLEGRVRFDLNRDDVGRLDVIVNGVPVKSFPRGTHPGETSFQLPYEFTSTSWVALQAVGGKVDEVAGRHPPFFVGAPTSQAHTAAIYVTIQGAPPLSAQPAAKVLARKWLAKLENLEARLAEDQIQQVAAPPGTSDGVELEPLRKNREALLQAIQGAKRYFAEMAR
jgi:hypothetical protein